MAHQGARVNVSNDWDAVAFKICLGSFAGAPIGSEKRKLADDQRFDVGLAGFLVFEIRADVADVGIRQADDLPGVAGIGENFLVTGEAGIENDFAATAGASTRCTAVKDSSVL
jgi:hypothetical protein